MEAEALRIPPGCDGMCAYIGMGVRGEDRGRNWGGFCFPVPWNISDYTRAHFFRAAFETNAFGVVANLYVLRGKGIALPQILHACGGQSLSALWPQILADTTGICVQTYRNPECTAAGAAAMAAVGIGAYSSMSEAASAFSEKGRLYTPTAGSPYPEISDDWMRLHRHMIAFS